MSLVLASRIPQFLWSYISKEWMKWSLIPISTFDVSWNTIIVIDEIVIIRIFISLLKIKFFYGQSIIIWRLFYSFTNKSMYVLLPFVIMLILTFIFSFLFSPPDACFRGNIIRSNYETNRTILHESCSQLKQPLKVFFFFLFISCCYNFVFLSRVFLFC